MDPSDPWAAYARAQSLADRYDVTDKTWAADEAAAEVIERIAAGASIAPTTEANLLVNRAAKHRRRRRIVRRNRARLAQAQPHPIHLILARAELARIAELFDRNTIELLVGVGMGATYNEVAEAVGVPVATARTKVRRARIRLAA